MTRDGDLARLADALHDLAKLYQFRSLEKRLYRALTVSQSYCLRILYLQGDKRMNELAADLGVRISTMTGVVDQLERRGLVKRVGDRRDRRSWLVTLTPKGRKAYQGGHEAFLAYLSPVFEGRSPVERQRILRALADVTGAVQAWQKNPDRREGRRGRNHQAG